jgi:hypothetical protein
MADISALQNALAGVVPDTGFMLDNRTALSHLQFIEQYARNVPYDAFTTWADYLFMNGNTPEKLAALYQDASLADGLLPPHQAMLLALLKLLETPRAFMNYYPDAHCDLYYRQLLKLQERPAEPSQVALSLIPDSTTQDLLVPAGTRFPAGQDREGVPVEYGLDADLLANHSHWSDLYWCLPPGERDTATGISGAISAMVYREPDSWPEEGMLLFAPTEQDQVILTGRALSSADLTNDPEVAQTFTLTLADGVLLPGLYADISDGDTWMPLTLVAGDSAAQTLYLTLPADSGEISPPDWQSGSPFTVPVLRLWREDGREVPVVTGFTMDTESGETSVSFDQRIMTPFGYAATEQPVNSMQLFLGIQGVLPGQALSLFWNLDSPQPPTLIWRYLTVDNQWQVLGTQLTDYTRGLFRSGLWSTVLPDDASHQAQAMPPGRYWFRADITPVHPVVGSRSAVYPWLKGLITNGMTATLLNVSTLDSRVVEEPLPAGTIQQTEAELPGLDQVEQPWVSWGGQPAETGSAFITRAAQRLSHRNRALTWTDIVMILKTAFPYVFDVVTPSGAVLTTVPALTEQQMIVIPLAAEKDNDDALRPVFNAARLDVMSHFLQGLASLWQNIRVSNPRYIDVLLDYTVVFHPGVSRTWAERELRETLTAQYMPWSTGAASGASTANRIDYYEVMATLQQQPYVDHVVSLTLDGGENSVQGNDDMVLILCWPVTIKDGL